MLKSSQRIGVRWLCRLYRMLLYAYPKEFRSKYGGEMVLVVHDRSEDLLRKSGPYALLRYAAQLGYDCFTTAPRERLSTMSFSNQQIVRFALLTAITVSLLMMSFKVLFYRPVLAMPGGLAFVLETAGLLVLYAVLVFWLTNGDGERRIALRMGTPLGLLAALIQIADLAREHFIQSGPFATGISGIALLFCTFGLWGIAGLRASRRRGNARSGALSGSWSALVTMSILVLFGFWLEFYLATPKPEYVATWNEFKHSGWSDVSAFTLANTLDSAQSHLILGPIVGAILGGLAGLLPRARGAGRQAPSWKPS